MTAALPNHPKSSHEGAETLMLVLREELVQHRSLCECVVGKREALRTANLQEMMTISEREAGIVRRIQSLEAQRTAIVPAGKSMREIAERLPEPLRGEMFQLHEELCTVVAAVRQESTVVRRAADELARHMAGLMLTIRSALSRAGVYGKKGQVESGEQLQFSVDVTS